MFNLILCDSKSPPPLAMSGAELACGPWGAGVRIRACRAGFPTRPVWDSADEAVAALESRWGLGSWGRVESYWGFLKAGSDGIKEARVCRRRAWGPGPGQDGSCSRAHRLGAALGVEGQGGASLISHAGLGEGAWAKPGLDTQNRGSRVGLWGAEEREA